MAGDRLRYFGPRGGFSDAVRAEGAFVFVSGQTSIDAAGAVVGAGDPARQAETTWANLKNALEKAGSDLAHVVKLTVLVTTREVMPHTREIRRRIYEPLGHFPASTLIVVSGLANPEFMIEIEAVALVSDE